MRQRWLLRLYPRAWRERYGDEFLALIESEGVCPRVFADVLWSASGERVRHALEPLGVSTPASFTMAVLRGLRNVIGAYSVVHTTPWLFHVLFGSPTASSAWWTVEGMMLSATIQARAGALACGVAFGVPWLLSRASHKTRSEVIDRLWAMTMGAVIFTEITLGTMGFEPTPETIALVLGEFSQTSLVIGVIVAVTTWARVAARRRLDTVSNVAGC